MHPSASWLRLILLCRKPERRTHESARLFYSSKSTQGKCWTCPTFFLLEATILINAPHTCFRHDRSLKTTSIARSFCEYRTVYFRWSAESPVAVHINTSRSGCKASARGGCEFTSNLQASRGYILCENRSCEIYPHIAIIQ